MRTFGQILKENDDIGPGFDLLRLALAIAILMSHAASAGGTRGFVPEFYNLMKGFISAAHAAEIAGAMKATVEAGTPWLRPLAVSHVPMFFALSGFLVTGSAFRTRRVLPFLALRFFRIFPALCVEVTLSAVLIGAMFTSLPIETYFTSGGFYAYFQNIIGDVHMHLPGVTFNGKDVVNANLWTLPGEFYCYLILAVLIFTGIAFNRTILTGIVLVATVALLLANSVFGFNAEPYTLANNINVYYFFVGAIFFHWRDEIPYSPWLAAACLPIAYALLFTTRTFYLIPPLLTYLTVFIGTTKFPRNRFLESGDYSYGIYLYGYPILQSIVGALPEARGHYFVLMPMALAYTLFVAFLSWHLVEKRFLGLRKLWSKKGSETPVKPARQNSLMPNLSDEECADLITY